MLNHFKKILVWGIIIGFASTLTLPYLKISHAYDIEPCFKNETPDAQSNHLAEIEERLDSIDDPCLDSLKEDLYKILTPQDFTSGNIKKIYNSLFQHEECRPTVKITPILLAPILPTVPIVIPNTSVADTLLAWLKDYADCYKNKTFTDLIQTGFEKDIPAAIKEQEFVNKLAGLFGGTGNGPCGLRWNTFGEFFKSLLNPVDRIIGGIIYGLFVIMRGLLVWVLKTFEWLLIPLHYNPDGTTSGFGGYIYFLDPAHGDIKLTLVYQLWNVIKNIANIGIIIGMIITAIATILRIEKFSWKKMLPKLLLVALLVNFSLIISGIFIDISNFISVTAVTKFGNVHLATAIVDQTICPVVGSFYHLSSWWKLVEAASLGLVLSAIFMYIFIGLLSYLFSRIVTIVICLITSPLAFLSFAFPGGEKAWDFWRQRFQQALVVLPVLCLTLLLSLKFISKIVEHINLVKNEGSFIITLAYAGFVIAFAQLVRYVAKYLGVEQVEKGFQMAKKAVNTVAMAAIAAGAAAVGGAVAGSQAFRIVGQKLTQTPILNKIGYKMLDQSDAARFANIRKSEEKMKTRSKDEILAIANGEAPLRANKAAYADYMGARSFALKSGWLKYDNKAIKAIKKDIENNNPDLNAKDLIHAFPQLFTYGANEKIEVLDTTAPDYTKKVADNIKKNISAEDMPKHTEQVIEAIKDAGGNVDEFLQEMVFAKTNLLRALLDNVAGDEYATGDKLTKATGIKGPWSGQNGQIVTVLKNLEKKAQNNYEALAKNPQATKQDLDRATEEWMKAQQAVDKLNNKLKSSQTFRETLDTEKI